MSKAKLMSLCMPLFKDLRVLQSETSKNLPDNFGEKLYQSLLTFEHAGLENQIPSHHSADAKYALAALLDEAIMRSDWKGKANWMDQSLQLRLFGEHLAGVNFFNRLARIRQSGELNVPVLEVYFVCLQLGFQGRYAMTQQEELKALQVDIKHQLDLYQGGFNSSLLLDTDSNPTVVMNLKRRLPDWAWIGIFIVLMTGMYSVYGLRFKELHQEHQDLVEHVISQVNQY